MFYHAIDTGQATSRARADVLWPLGAVLSLSLLLAALNPTVFVGGGYDDWNYLQAASCFAERGFCIARDHWWTRLPVVAPTGAAIALFGKVRWAVALVPLFYAIAALTLFVALVQRQFGRLEAAIAGAVLVATPVIADGLMRLSVDLAELAWLLGALFCLQQRTRTGRSHWCLLSGLALGLAIETRATSLVAVPIFAAALALSPLGKRDRLAFAGGLAAVLAAQALADLALTGDALHYWRLQLGHTRLPSSELSAAAAHSGPPIFNLAVIRAWPPSSGISIHWSIDALVNLLANPAAGLTLCAAIVLVALSTRQVDWRPRDKRLLLLCLGAAVLWFGALVFALAVDPKPRMFEPVVAVAALGVGLLCAGRLRAGDRLLPLAIIALLVANGVLHAAGSVSLVPATDAAERLLGQAFEPPAVDSVTARFLALQAKPPRVYPASGVTRLLMLRPNHCPGRVAGADRWRLASQQRFGTPPEAAMLCLYRR